jgi:hypothetical protein
LVSAMAVSLWGVGVDFRLEYAPGPDHASNLFVGLY